MQLQNHVMQWQYHAMLYRQQKRHIDRHTDLHRRRAAVDPRCQHHRIKSAKQLQHCICTLGTSWAVSAAMTCSQVESTLKNLCLRRSAAVGRASGFLSRHFPTTSRNACTVVHCSVIQYCAQKRSAMLKRLRIHPYLMSQVGVPDQYSQGLEELK